MIKVEHLAAEKSPIERLRRATALAQLEGSAILESGTGFGELGRYGLYAAFPRATFTIIGDQWKLDGDWPLEHPKPTHGPFAALRALLAQTRRPAMPHGSIFQGGWIGLFGYDLAPLIERLPQRHTRNSRVPDLSISYYDTFAIHDEWSSQISLHATDMGGATASDAADRLCRLEEALSSQPVDQDADSLRCGPLESDFTPDEYCHAVARVIEYLRAGDIFQANLSQEFSAPFQGRIEHLFERAMRMSPSPFGALIRGDGWDIVSTSPERFLLADADGTVETRPIKGTRPRGRDPIHDLLLKEELSLSEKDAAELTMIVDLERNDLGRVCQYGSVRVQEHRRIESYANVHHSVSTVRGQLRPECDLVDLFLATFPGGSITGAPKIRAMEIIDELERGRRGAYTGAIGYISDHGRMDLNIAIRTIVRDGDRVSYRVGGGIVIDSDPLTEYRETLVKGQQIRRILQGAE